MRVLGDEEVALCVFPNSIVVECGGRADYPL